MAALDYSGLLNAMAELVQASTELQLAVIDRREVDDEAVWVSNFMRDHSRYNLRQYHLNWEVSLLDGTYRIIGIRDNKNSPIVLRNAKGKTVFKSAGAIFCAITIL